jgi:hypothetical protein
MPPQIAQAGGTQTGIADGVNQGVGIGMPLKPPRMVDLYATEYEISALDQRMHIVTVTDANQARSFSCCFR